MGAAESLLLMQVVRSRSGYSGGYAPKPPKEPNDPEVTKFLKILGAVVLFAITCAILTASL